MTNGQAGKLIIVSFASQNPERQQELREGILELPRTRTIELRFPRDQHEAAGAMPDAEVLFTWSLTEEMFRAAGRLHWMHLGGAGADRVLFPAFRDSSVLLTNSRGMHGDFIAEWVLAALFHIAQRLSEAEAWRHDHQWKPHKDEMTRNRFLLRGKRALIVGYGAIGGAIAQSLTALGLHCEGVTRASRSASLPLHTVSELPGIIGYFDVIVVALPLTAETHGLFDRKLMGAMKPGSILVNIARGKLIDEHALLQCLQTGPLSYAALDVFTDEPLPESSPLYDIPNVFMTPHVSGNYPEYSRVANQIFLANLGRYLNHEPLQNLVDKSRGY